MKKLVLKLCLQDQREKQKAMSIVSGISGVTSLGIDMDEKKMTVVGEFDAVEVASKLRKICHAEIVMLGENKEEKEDGGKREGGGGGGGGGGDGGGRGQVEPVEGVPWYWDPYVYPAVVCEEVNPNPCVIC